MLILYLFMKINISSKYIGDDCAYKIIFNIFEEAAKTCNSMSLVAKTDLSVSFL